MSDNEAREACCSAPTDGGSDETAYKLHRRFDRLGRLFGDDAIEALTDLRVLVVGLGGVGGFAAEALVRSAVGHLTLVDFDDVCVTNSNRQVQAMKGMIGKPKAWVLRDRLQLINPQAKIEAKRAFYNAAKSEQLLAPPWPGRENYDWVVDCIDNFTAKAHLIAACRARGISVISSMGAAGKIDPTRVKVADLAKATMCPMARDMRKILRHKYDFPMTGKMGVEVVFSDEKRNHPRELRYDGGKGFSCVCSMHHDEHSCDSRAMIDGTAMYVTTTFGMVCASTVINRTAMPLVEKAPPARSNFESRKAKRSDDEMSDESDL